MSRKNLFIGDFRIKNCTHYGEYEVIDELQFGEPLKLEYDVDEKLIVVKARKVLGEYVANSDHHKKSENDWVVFGEVDMPEQIRKVMGPILQGRNKESIFECKLNSFDKKISIDERFQVTVWATGSNDAKGEDGE